jgi:hypothetical protein
MKVKIIPGQIVKKTKAATRQRPTRKATEEPPAAEAAPPLKTRRKTLVTSAVEKIKRVLKPRRSPRASATGAPSILLEGDHAPSPSLSGPGEKYSLGPGPAAPRFEAEQAELPEAYGTKKLFLTARDPNWLYANWDLTLEQQRKLNAKSSDGHLVLRVFADKVEGYPLYEIHVHPESRHWFAHVERAGDAYAAELGFYSSLGRWTRVAVSAATITPSDAIAAETEVEFATIPFEYPFARLMQIVKMAVRDNIPLARAIEELRRKGNTELPQAGTLPPAKWTPQQEAAFAKIISIDDMRRVWMGSLEITELIRRRLSREISSLSVSSLGVSSFSSAFGGMEQQKGFWFNVNAELIIYGATEPNAKVTLGGNQIKLRPDGSFSYRFALPDGKYDLPAVAVSADGTDGRAANLKFSRETEYLGDVGAHPQDPSLAPPLPENI